MSGKEQEANYPPPAYEPAQPGYSEHQQYGYPPQQPAYPPQQPAYPAHNVQMHTQQGYVHPQGYTAVQVVVANQPLQGPVPDDYCTYSVLNTIFCCFWIGIFAIIKSQSVRDAIARGDRQGADRESAEALRLNKIALGVGITFNVIYLLGITLYMLFIFGVFW